MDSTQDVDLLIVGAGLRGLRAALTNRREHPTANLALVEEQPQPGGTFRTQRSNGFARLLASFVATRSDLAQRTLFIGRRMATTNGVCGSAKALGTPTKPCFGPNSIFRSEQCPHPKPLDCRGH